MAEAAQLRASDLRKREADVAFSLAGEGQPSSSQAQAPPQCLIATFFTHKGGTGKSTCLTHLAGTLGKLGKRVLMIDADAQANLSLQWYPGNIVGKEIEDYQSQDEGDTPAHAPQGGKWTESELSLWKGRHELRERLTAKEILPDVKADMRVKSDAMLPSAIREVREKIEEGSNNLHSGLAKFGGLYDDPLPVPIEVNTDDYEGRLLLLPPGPDLHEFAAELSRYASHEASSPAPARMLAAFGELSRALAAEHRLDFILVDLGPHVDKLHQVIVSSSDCIQCVVDDSVYAFQATSTLLERTLPGWHAEHQVIVQAQEANKRCRTLFNSEFPKILPALGCKYKWDSKANKVSWNASNLLASTELAFVDTNVPEKIRALYLPAFYSSKTTKNCTMLLPIMRQLTDSILIGQETGRPIFDLKDRQVRDYYENKPRRGYAEQISQLNEEKSIVKEKFMSLARMYLELHRRRAPTAFCQRAQEAARLAPAGAKRERKDADPRQAAA